MNALMMYNSTFGNTDEKIPLSISPMHTVTFL